MAKSVNAPSLLDADEAAAYLHVTKRWMRRAIAEGRFPVVKLGALVRVDERDLAAYVAANRRAAR